MTKYKAVKTEVDGIKFDSKKEAKRYLVLKEMEKNGEISDLKRQVPYELIPKQKTHEGKAVRSCEYKADFVYLNKEGRTVVEDVKGFKTPDYKIKWKLMLHRYGIEVKEV